MTFWSLKWRSLSPWKGHLNHPKRSLERTWQLRKLTAILWPHVLSFVSKSFYLKESKRTLQIPKTNISPLKNAGTGRLSPFLLVSSKQPIFRVKLLIFRWRVALNHLQWSVGWSGWTSVDNCNNNGDKTMGVNPKWCIYSNPNTNWVLYLA